MDEKEFRDLKAQVDDTHRMVARLYKFEKSRRLWRALKIIILAVIIVGAYFAILPVFNRALDTYNSFSNGVSNIQNFQFPWQNGQEQAQ